MPLAEELTLARRYSISCPALPTCGLAVTESERIMPEVMDSIEAGDGRTWPGFRADRRPYDRLPQRLREALHP